MKAEHEKLIRETAQQIAKGVPPVDDLYRLLAMIYHTGRMVGVAKGWDAARTVISNPKR